MIKVKYADSSSRNTLPAPPLVSIIVPIYNVEAYLKRCVDSILRQSYSNIEVILVNDGSKDRSGEIAESYAAQDHRIRVIHKANGGLSSARNSGIAIAKGEMLSFIDSDDFISPAFINKLVSLSGTHDADIAVCSLCQIKKKQKRRIIAPSNSTAVLPSSKAIRKLLLSEITNHSCNKLFRKHLFAHIKYPEGRNYEDIAIMHLLFDKARTVATTGFVGYFYDTTREGRISSNKAVLDIENQLSATLERYVFFEKNPEFRNYSNYQCLITAYYVTQSVLWLGNIRFLFKSKDYRRLLLSIKIVSAMKTNSETGNRYTLKLIAVCPILLTIKGALRLYDLLSRVKI